MTKIYQAVRPAVVQEALEEFNRNQGARAMKKPTAKQQAAIDAARIQTAVTGMIIPMMTIPRLYAYAKKLIAEGADDAALAAGVRAFYEEKELT